MRSNSHSRSVLKKEDSFYKAPLSFEQQRYLSELSKHKRLTRTTSLNVYHRSEPENRSFSRRTVEPILGVAEKPGIADSKILSTRHSSTLECHYPRPSKQISNLSLGSYESDQFFPKQLYSVALKARDEKKYHGFKTSGRNSNTLHRSQSSFNLSDLQPPLSSYPARQPTMESHLEPRSAAHVLRKTSSMSTLIPQTTRFNSNSKELTKSFDSPRSCSSSDAHNDLSGNHVYKNIPLSEQYDILESHIVVNCRHTNMEGATYADPSQKRDYKPLNRSCSCITLCNNGLNGRGTNSEYDIFSLTAAQVSPKKLMIARTRVASCEEFPNTRTQNNTALLKQTNENNNLNKQKLISEAANIKNSSQKDIVLSPNAVIQNLLVKYGLEQSCCQMQAQTMSNPASVAGHTNIEDNHDQLLTIDDSFVSSTRDKEDRFEMSEEEIDRKQLRAETEETTDQLNSTDVSIIDEPRLEDVTAQRNELSLTREENHEGKLKDTDDCNRTKLDVAKNLNNIFSNVRKRSKKKRGSRKLPFSPSLPVIQVDPSVNEAGSKGITPNDDTTNLRTKRSDIASGDQAATVVTSPEMTSSMTSQLQKSIISGGILSSVIMLSALSLPVAISQEVASSVESSSPQDIKSLGLTSQNSTPSKMTTNDVTSAEMTSTDTVSTEMKAKDDISLVMTSNDVTTPPMTLGDTTTSSQDLTSTEATSPDLTSPEITSQDLTSLDVISQGGTSSVTSLTLKKARTTQEQTGFETMSPMTTSQDTASTSSIVTSTACASSKDRAGVKTRKVLQKNMSRSLSDLSFSTERKKKGLSFHFDAKASSNFKRQFLTINPSDRKSSLLSLTDSLASYEGDFCDFEGSPEEYGRGSFSGEMRSRQRDKYRDSKYMTRQSSFLSTDSWSEYDEVLHYDASCDKGQIKRNDSGLGDEIQLSPDGFKNNINGEVERSNQLASIVTKAARHWRAKTSGKKINYSDKKFPVRRVSPEKHSIDCPDCGKHCSIDKDKKSVISSGLRQSPICEKCQDRRVERKQAVVELFDTEFNYGNDFQIIKEEFFSPMQSARIVTPENLAKIFLNIQELAEVSVKFCKRMGASMKECSEQDDEDFCHMEVGKIFVENVEFFQAYELYCSQQPEAMSLLEFLQKKNEVLKVFLNITCRENPRCRKMDINSFLVTPVQRLMKYPLLLSRIRQATPIWHKDRDHLKLAQRRVEEQIAKINSLTKSSEIKTKKLNSNLGRQEVVTADRLKKLACDVLNWDLDEIQLLLHGVLKLTCCEFGGTQAWSKRTLRRTLNTHVLFCLRGHSQPIVADSDNDDEDDNILLYPKTSEISDSSLLLLKQKTNGKYTLFREEIKLCDCVVYKEKGNSFGLIQMGKETFHFNAQTPQEARKWFKHLRLQAKDQGKWRRRRNAAANIMLKTS